MAQETQDPPVLPVDSSASPGEAGGGVVNVRVDEAWHVSTLSEEKQYFSQDVSRYHNKTLVSLISPFQASLFEAAVTAIKARLDAKDSNIQKAWLLTE